MYWCDKFVGCKSFEVGVKVSELNNRSTSWNVFTVYIIQLPT